MRGDFMCKVGLVLEGGGMRGVYTTGVLDYFMEQNLYVPYVVGVSAGACNALSYVSKQIGRSKKSTIGSIDDPRYINYKNLFQHGYLLHMDLIFDEIPNQTIPFDYDAFYNSEMECVIGTTNCRTGKPMYFHKKDCKDLMMVCRASSSLPFFSPIVDIDDEPLLDGGIADSIPIKKSIQDGNEKHIVVLTRNKGYRKNPTRMRRLIKKVYPQFPNLQEAIINRYQVYNETIDLVEQLENENKVFVIRPTQPVKIGRVEKNVEKLTEFYNCGYEDAKFDFKNLKEWIVH